MQFQCETLEGIKVEFLKLAELYHTEVGTWDDIRPNVDFDAYKEIGDDVVKFYTVRNNGELIGFCSYLLNYHNHYSDSFQACMDLIFVHPKHRGIGAEMIKYTEQELKKLGVQVVYQHSSLKKDLSKFYERLGYKPINIEFAKRLDI